ncbi:MAG: RNA-guided endonuclease InsQ/TnpB family protein, partial [Thermoprotei archaeon]
MSAFDMINDLTQLKKQDPWLREVNSQSLQQALLKLHLAFKFFRHNADYPKFKSKKDNQYFVVPRGSKAILNRLVIPKFLEGIRYRDHTTIPDNIHQVVVKKEGDRYYASISYESYERPPKGSGAVGLDMGVAQFLTTPDGGSGRALERVQKAGKRVKIEDKNLSRKKKGSNRRKQVRRLRRVYQRIKDARNDFFHKVSTTIA